MENARAILKKIRQIELKTRGMIDAAFAGQYRSVFKGRGMNFEEVREYQPGDEVRTIDWNVTARMGEAYTKKFTEERELVVMLLVDVSRSGEFGSGESSKREMAAEIACLLAFSAVRNGDKVGLILFSDHVELFVGPAKGRSHALRMIREILFFQPKGKGTDVSGTLDYMNQVLHRRAVAFLISDFQASNFDRAIRVTGKRHDLVAMVILDPREEEFPDVGRVVLEDAETGERLLLNTTDARVRLAFQKAVERRNKNVEAVFRRCRVDSIILRTNYDYVPALRRFFQTRTRRLTYR